MKKKIKYILVSFIFIVSAYVTFTLNDVQAISSEEAGKYVAEFAINFYDAHAPETTYGTDGRTAAYEGNKYGGVYNFDCVGWLGFAVHQSIGIGADYYSEFAVPYHGNPNPGYFNGYSEVLGSGGSSSSIPIDQLQQQLKPGDLLMATGPRKHVLIYVGDGTLIHCTGHGPGSEYGGNNGYGLVKETVSHFYQDGYGIESVGRLTEETAASINESELTTVFGETGKGLTGIWQKASSGASSANWDSSTGNSGTSSSGGSSKKVIEAGFQADYNLGLVYPKDNKNTPLNSFIDFTLPFLQTWMIPLAMNSGAIDSSTQTNKGNNANFTYLTIKEAMSDIIVDRYDITKCTLKTKYKVYDTITYQVTHDKDGKKTTKEISREHTDESENGPMAEEYVDKKFDVNTKYCIKKAHTFDVKIDNEYTYTKYSDSDVSKRINPDKENKENGDAYKQGGDPGGDGSYTYTVKDGHYVNVTRIWEDKFEIGDSHVEEYTVEDVKKFIDSPGLVANKVTSSQTSSSSGEIFNGTKYELTEDQKISLAKYIYQEYNGDIEGMNAIASHMCNLYEYMKWCGAISQSKSFADYILSTGWYAQETQDNENYDEDALKAVEQCIVNGQRTIPLYINEYDMYPGDIISPKGKDEYVQHETRIEGKPGGQGLFYKIYSNAGGANLFYYDEKYKEYIEGNSNIDNSSVKTNTSSSEENTPKNSNSKVDTSGLGLFTGEDTNYYNLLKNSSAINRVDLANSKPENYLQYLNKGSQYSNHVGYSRGFLSFAYDELRKLFKEKFQNKGVLPFVYGSSLGYDTFDAEYIMDAGNFEIQGSNDSNNNTLASAEASMGSLEKDPNKKNILLIAGHDSEQREKPGEKFKYTEPTQNRKIVMELAGAIQAAGMNAVIANRVMAHNLGKGDYKDQWGVLWGDEDVWFDLTSAQARELFTGYDYIFELHHNSSKGEASGALLTYPAGFSATELDEKFLQCFVNNNLGNKKLSPIIQSLRNYSISYSMGIPLTYIECEFYDNETAMDYIDANYGKIAMEMAMILREHFGVTTPMNQSSSVDTSNISGIDIPSGLGKLHTYTRWETCGWTPNVNSHDLIDYLGGKVTGSFYDSKRGHMVDTVTQGGKITFSSYGAVKYGDYFAVATTSTMGKIGDIIFGIQDDGTVIPAIIADEKSQEYVGWDTNPANKYGHSNGQCIMEIEASTSLVNKMKEIDTGTYGNVDSRLDHYITKIVNIGSIYDKGQYLNNLDQAVKDAGLANMQIIKP